MARRNDTIDHPAGSTVRCPTCGTETQIVIDTIEAVCNGQRTMRRHRSRVMRRLTDIAAAKEPALPHTHR